jgi:hypothetical protein
MELHVEANRIDIGDWKFPALDDVLKPGLAQKVFCDALGASLEGDPPTFEFSDDEDCEHPMEVSFALPFQQHGGYVWLSFRLDQFLIDESKGLDKGRKAKIAAELRRIADTLVA